MYDDLDARDTPFLYSKDFESETLVCDFLPHFQEVALQFQEQSGERVGIALHLVELVVDIKDLAEIRQRSLSLKDIGVVVKTGIGLLLLVILVVYLAHDFLKHVFKGDKATCTTKLIDHNGDMYLVS